MAEALYFTVNTRTRACRARIRDSIKSEQRLNVVEIIRSRELAGPTARQTRHESNLTPRAPRVAYIRLVLTLPVNTRKVFTLSRGSPIAGEKPAWNRACDNTPYLLASKSIFKRSDIRGEPTACEVAYRPTIECRGTMRADFSGTFIAIFAGVGSLAKHRHRRGRNALF